MASLGAPCANRAEATVRMIDHVGAIRHDGSGHAAALCCYRSPTLTKTARVKRLRRAAVRSSCENHPISSISSPSGFGILRAEVRREHGRDIRSAVPVGIGHLEVGSTENIEQRQVSGQRTDLLVSLS